ncbi:MAG: hypothetical protein RLZZ227_1304 [Pseudomonadota bacterium]|jgi:hypothetical protein
MNYFQLSRFLRVLANDLLLLDSRRVLFASLGLVAIGTLIYVASVAPSAGAALPQLANLMFLVLLIGGGSIFTSMIFNDMHHPLERFHYLTLPCSNLERFLSRYLITAPLFVAYTVVLYRIFEMFANFLCALFWDGETVPLLEPGSDMVSNGIQEYFLLHVFVFAGAIWFRSYALIKTWFAAFVFFAALGIVCFVAMRIVYWDSFVSLFTPNPAGPYINFEALAFGEDGLAWYQKLLGLGFLLWVLFLAYLGLREHEVQDGL